MSTIEKEKSKQDIEGKWKSIIEESRAALELNRGQKAFIIQRTCTRLEESGMPLGYICSTVIKELVDYVSRKYIYEVVEKKYKDADKSHEHIRPYNKKNKVPEQSAIQVPSNEYKKNLEEDFVRQELEEPEPEPVWQIPVEQYRIEDLEQYDKPFLIQLVKYLHDRVIELQIITGLEGKKLAPESSGKSKKGV